MSLLPVAFAAFAASVTIMLAPYVSYLYLVFFQRLLPIPSLVRLKVWVCVRRFNPAGFALPFDNVIYHSVFLLPSDISSLITPIPVNPVLLYRWWLHHL